MAAQNPNPPTVFRSTHLNLVQLKRELEEHDYIHNEIPTYPECVEFHISNVSHVTNTYGLDNIMATGFKGGREGFVWWSSNIPDEEFEEAQERYLNREFPPPDSAPEEVEEQFLKKFATSPAFQDESRYGNFRFTFSLEELLQMYKDQLCGGCEPVLRVYDTKVYKQEIMYTVVVHSPDPEVTTFYEEYPLLESVGDGAVCAYNEGIHCLIWRAQAMCGSHKYKLIKEPVRVRAVECSDRWYVWDHVTVAFHVPPKEAIQVETEHLLKSLSPCEIAPVRVRYRSDGLVSLTEAKAMIGLSSKKKYQAKKKE